MPNGGLIRNWGNSHGKKLGPPPSTEPFYKVSLITINSKCKLKTCPYCTKTCPHWTCFGTNYPKNGVGLALTMDKNFKFSKVLLSPKFKHNSMAVKKKKFLLHI